MVIIDQNFLHHKQVTPVWQKNKWIISQVLCDILFFFAYNEKKKYMLTSISIFFPYKYEKNVKGGLVATQGLPYKQIVLTKAYVMKGWGLWNFEIARRKTNYMSCRVDLHVKRFENSVCMHFHRTLGTRRQY